jgi:hypothetical protein
MRWLAHLAAVGLGARKQDHVVLAASMDKPHGLRECHVVGPGGYVFVPSKAIHA